MAVRPASTADIPALRNLIDVSVRALNAPDYTPDQIEAALIHVLGLDTQLIADGTYFVIETGGGILASGGWSARQTPYGGDQAKRGEDALLDPAVDAARIRAFYVHPDWTRRGFARRIYEACESAARSRGFRRFELVATLTGARLYAALGFVARDAVDVPLAGGIVLPCVRMDRTIPTASTV